ncbi:hypothetical protein [Amycolatopsis sp. lyj-112]|uniref:hypothetical protein n=1 Tax=Amycolatopsis sp. lyj-112 TaxID=2789288 RepID=UPI0039786BDC
MTTRICETHHRSSLIVEAHPRGSLKGAAAQADRYRFPRWSMRDRRVQRLRGWLSGAPG